MRSIDAKTLKRRMDRGDEPVVIDVLPAEYFEKQHIPGAHSAPVADDAFVGRVGQLAPDRDQEVVVYCANEDCDLSLRAARRLETLGYRNVVEFTGGLKEWEDEGFEVRSGHAAGRA